MRIPEQTITEITEKLDIVDIVADYVPLTRKGNRYWGLCPFHTEKTPSFSVTPEKNIYYCFGCHKGGGALSFIMEMEKLPFVEAIKLAAKRAGVEIQLEEEREGSLKRDAYCELYKRVAGSMNHILLHSDQASQARKYLQSRKLSEEIIGMFDLGYAPAEREWLFNFLEKKNYSPDFLSKTGLFSKGKGSYFSNRIMFPISTAQDEVIAFGGRALVEGGPKYLNSPETAFFRKRNSLFAINLALPAIKKEGSVYLVEGYMDVIAMHAAGIANCVAPLGTAFTREQAAFLKRYAEKAVLFFDTDEAGIKATLRTIEILETALFQVEVVSQESQDGQQTTNGPCKDPGGSPIASHTGTDSPGKPLKDPAEIFEKDG
ncbi:MAG: DNA primase, partial [Spirochaetaceae bacterium]